MNPFPMLECAAIVLDDQGFQAMAANVRASVARLREMLADAYKVASDKPNHSSDCATSMAPAEDPGPCDCGSQNGERK